MYSTIDIGVHCNKFFKILPPFDGFFIGHDVSYDDAASSFDSFDLIFTELIKIPKADLGDVLSESSLISDRTCTKAKHWINLHSTLLQRFPRSPI